MTGIVVHEVTEDRPDLLDELAVVHGETEAEINPDDPPAPAAEIGGDLFAPSISLQRRAWVGLLDGSPAGELIVSRELDETNRHIVQGEWLAVRPGARGRGVASAVLARALDVLMTDGVTSLMLWTPVLEGARGPTYAERRGLTSRLEERCSRLRIAEHDEGLVGRWIEQGRDRQDGYRVVQYVGPCPDEHLDALVEAHRAMEDMPTDEMEWTIPVMTTDKVRSRDETWAASGLLGVTTLAIAPDGSAAGLSELVLNTHRPSLAWQMDTGVVDDHRGRGLGRWLKAENLSLARRTEPRVEVVETYNAQSNPWMLDINVAMGFRPHVGYRVFQGDIVAARATLP